MRNEPVLRYGKSSSGMTQSDTLVAYILDRVPYNASLDEIKARGLARLHDEYVRSWQQRMRHALRQSPVGDNYAR